VITRLRVSRASFCRWRRLGTGPAWLRLPNGGVRIRRSALDLWLRGARYSHHEEEDAA